MVRALISAAALAGLSLIVGSCVTVEVQEAPGPAVVTANGQPAGEPGPAVVVTTRPPDAELASEDAPPPHTTEASEDHPPSTTVPEPAPTTQPEAPTTTVPLPGEAYDIGPAEGVSLAVVGVDHDDVLNVRDVPAGEIIATLDVVPLIVGLLDVRDARTGELVAALDSWEGGIVATGRTRKLPTTIWHEVRVAGITGWASASYLAQMGATDDATAEIVGIVGGIPVADTLFDLGLTVAQVVAAGEPSSRIVVSVTPNVFEGYGEMTVDVVNVGDDSVLGFRLDLFTHPIEDWMQPDPGPVTLKSVERTVLCHSHRGVTEDGLCL